MLSGGAPAIAQLAPQASSIASTLYNGISAASKNPQFWTSFINTVGGEYQDAIDNGAEPTRALLAAVGASLVNSGIEVGGGIETLPEQLRSGDTNRWLAVFKSGLEEATEEPAQNIVSGAFQKATFDQDRPAFSTTDENAVVNPRRELESAAMAFGSGAILGAGQNIATSVLDSRRAALTPAQAQQDTEVSDAARAVLDVVDGQKNTQSVNENGLVSLSKREQDNLSSGNRNKIVSTFRDAVSFIRNALSNKQSNDRAYLGKIPDTTAQMVMDETGINISGYNAILSSDNVRHIIRNHGNANTEESRGQTAITENDILQIPFILSDPDRVTLSGQKDNRGRNSLIFEKRIGDNYVTIQAVADGTHSIQTDTLYKKKMTEEPTDTGYNAGKQVTGPAHNVQNVPPSGSSVAFNIPQSNLENNGNIVQTAAENPVQTSDAARAILDAVEQNQTPVHAQADALQRTGNETAAQAVLDAVFGQQQGTNGRQVNIDNANSQDYTLNRNGGVYDAQPFTNGILGKGNRSEGSSGARISGGQIGLGADASGREAGIGSSGLRVVVSLSPESQNTLNRRGVVNVELQDYSADNAAFSADRARRGNPAIKRMGRCIKTPAGTGESRRYGTHSGLAAARRSRPAASS